MILENATVTAAELKAAFLIPRTRGPLAHPAQTS
jgi:hypothetical protein